ncbi:MAG: hypothetical protein DSY37_04610 [Hyperthermus sp.]|nr:MAG: hypothetical protein DSY37_04610 [Hyperthermus sp.]
MSPEKERRSLGVLHSRDLRRPGIFSVNLGAMKPQALSEHERPRTPALPSKSAVIIQKTITTKSYGAGEIRTRDIRRHMQ